MRHCWLRRGKVGREWKFGYLLEPIDVMPSPAPAGPTLDPGTRSFVHSQITTALSVPLTKVYISSPFPASMQPQT
jgi:hypothetical protein